jgi:hypothetical protein
MNKMISKVLVMLIISSTISSAIISSSALEAIAQSATLEDVISEIVILNNRLDDIQANITVLNLDLALLNTAFDKIESIVYSLSATTATTSEIAQLKSVLDSLADMIESILDSTTVINSTIAHAHVDSKLELAGVSSTLDELSTTINDLIVIVDSINDKALIPDDIATSKKELCEEIKELRMLVVLTIGLALVAATAAIVAVCLMLRKTAKNK